MRKFLSISICFTFVFHFNLSAQVIYEKIYEELPNYFFGYRLLNLQNDSTNFSLGVNNRIYILKTDYEGNTIWTKKFTRNNFQTFGSDMILNGSNILIAGFSPDTIDTIFLSNNRDDILLLNIDTSSGNLITSKTFGDTLDDSLIKIIKTSDNNFVGVGIANAEPNPPYGSCSALIMKFDSNLNCIWAKTYKDIHVCIFSSIVESNDGFFYITGGRNAYGDEGYNDAVIIKTDTSGNLVWSKKFNNGYNEYANDIVLVGNHIYIGGNYEDALNAAFFSSFIAKIDTSGNLNWLRKYDTSYPLSSTRFYKKNDNEFFLTSVKFILKTDSSGSLIFANEYSLSITDLKFTSDGGCLVSSGSGSGIKMCKTDSNLYSCSSSTQAFLDSLFTNLNDSDISLQQSEYILSPKPGVHEIPVSVSTTTQCFTATGNNDNESGVWANHHVKVIPNPFTDLITLNFSSPTLTTFLINVRIINMVGNCFFEEDLKLINSSEVHINSSNFCPGIYFILINGDYNINQKIIKM